jgi:hypothetical protein
MGADNGQTDRAPGAIISFARDTKEGVALLRRRLVLFWGVVEIISLIAFIPTQIVGIRSLGHSLAAQVGHPGTLAQLLSLVVVGGIWLVCRYTSPSRQVLELLDAAATVTFCLGGALMTYFAPMALLPGLDQGGPVSSALPPGLLATVAIFTMRAALIQQVLINLVKNAVEAGGPRTEVRVQVERPAEGGWRVTVLDRGPGMTDEVMRNALLPFFTTTPGGSGLGLALCREILEQHHGRLRLARRVEGGMAISFWLPDRERPLPALDPGSRIRLTLTHT